MKIFQIEVTNVCNFKCPYCPRTEHMTREQGFISNAILDKVVSIMPKQEEVRLHHYGESLMFLEACLYAIKKLSAKVNNVILNTNGSLLTPWMADQLFNAGLGTLYVTWHRAESIIHLKDLPVKYRSRIKILKICKAEEFDAAHERMLAYKEMGFQIELKRLRDLGQIKETDSAIAKESWRTCAFLREPECVIAWDGKVLTCCEDYNSASSMGNIMEMTTLPERNMPYAACRTCLGYGNSLEETERVVVK